MDGVQLTPSGAFSAPLIISDEGVKARVPMTLNSLVAVLDRAFQRRSTKQAREPGNLTTLIKSLPPNERAQPACPRLTISVLTSRTVLGVDPRTNRKDAEAAMLAHWDGRFHNNNHEMVAANGWEPSLIDIEELGKEIVRVLCRNGNDLIRPEDSVIDVGTGHGFVAKHLASQGVNVEAIEPGEPDEHQIGFPETKKLTARQYTENYPGMQFSVVHVANFNPFFGKRDVEMNEVREFIEDLAKMTSNGGTTLIGISSMDPQFVSGPSEYRLQPELEKNFGSTVYVSAQQLGEKMSIGGQMGLFKCSEPKRGFT